MVEILSEFGGCISASGVRIWHASSSGKHLITFQCHTDNKHTAYFPSIIQRNKEWLTAGIVLQFACATDTNYFLHLFVITMSIISGHSLAKVTQILF